MSGSDCRLVSSHKRHIQLAEKRPRLMGRQVIGDCQLTIEPQVQPLVVTLVYMCFALGLQVTNLITLADCKQRRRRFFQNNLPRASSNILKKSWVKDSSQRRKRLKSGWRHYRPEYCLLIGSGKTSKSNSKPRTTKWRNQSVLSRVVLRRKTNLLKRNKNMYVCHGGNTPTHTHLTALEINFFPFQTFLAFTTVLLEHWHISSMTHSSTTHTPPEDSL